MAIQGTVPVGGSFAPTDSADSFGTHNDKWGIGGYRIVKTIADRDAIPINESNLLNLDDALASGRRKLGMMVYVSDDNKLYVLTIAQATWDGYTESQKVTALADDDNFVEFVGGSGGGGISYYETNSGVADTYTITTTTPITINTLGDTYLIKFDVANTGPSTLNIDSIGAVSLINTKTQTTLVSEDIVLDSIHLVVFTGTNFEVITIGGSTTPTLQEVLTEGNEADGINIKLINDTAIELDNGSLLRKGSYNFGNIGDVIVTDITDDGDGFIADISGWGDIGGTKWSDLNGTYIKTAVAVTPSGYGDGYQGMHTPVAGTFNYYLQLLGNPGLNGIAYFLAPGNRSGWGSDPDDDDNTDAPVNYWRLLVGADDPYCYFTNPSTDIYNFPTTGWVPVDDTLTLDEGLNGYDYIATYDTGFTANISYILNGSGGISRICSIGYEDMWQAGIRYVFGNSGTIREATNCFDYIPDSSFDVNKRFAVGSRWVLDNGDIYICTDNTSNAATWVKIKVSAGTGGGGVVYYLNFDTAGESPLTNIPTTPNTPKELGISGEANTTSYQSAHLSTGSYDFLASFVTDVGFPSAETIPAGIWDFNIFAESSSTNSANQVYFQVKIYQYDDTETLTLLGTSSDVYIYDPAEINQYVASIIVPQTTLLETDRIVVYLYGRSHQSNKHLTFHFGGNYPSHVHTTLSSVSGTGFVTVTDGIFDPVASPTINLNKLTAGTANQVLRMPSVDAPPAWGAINLASSDAVTGTLAVGNGGTGFATYAIGDLLYANTTTSLAKLAGVATGSVLISGGVGAAPSWSTGPTLRSIILNNATNANTITLNTGATSPSSYNLTLPIAAPAAGQYLQFAVGGVATWVNGTVNGVTTPAIIGGSPNANGMTIASSTLTLQPANASFGGVVTTAPQTFAGAKTFNNDIVAGAATLNLFNTVATNLNIGGAATTFALGGTATTALTATLFGNLTSSGVTKAINIGTLGANGSTTNITLGSAVSGALGTVTINGGGSATNPSLSISTNSSYSWMRIGTGTGAFPNNDVSSNTRSVGDRIVFSDSPYASIGHLANGTLAINTPTFWTGNVTNFYPVGGSSMNFTTGNSVSSSSTYISGGFNFFVPYSEAVTDNIGFGAGFSPSIFSVFRSIDSNGTAITGMVVRSPRRYFTSNNRTISNITPSSPSAGFITVTVNSVTGLSVDQVVRITGVIGSTGYNNIVSIIKAINVGANTIQLVSSVTGTYGSAGVVTPVYATSGSSSNSSTLGIYFDKDDALVSSSYNGSDTASKSPNLTPVLTFVRTGLTTPVQTFELLNHSSITGTLNFGTNINTFNFATNTSTINIGDCRFGGANPVAQTINIGTTYSFNLISSNITRNINLGHDGSTANGILSQSFISTLNIRIGQTTNLSGGIQITNIGFYGATPVAKGTTANITGLTFAVNSGTAVNSASTFGGYTIAQIAAALQRLGLIT